MIDFNGLLQKLEEQDQEKNKDIKQYATNVWEAIMRPKYDEFFDEFYWVAAAWGDESFTPA